MTRLVPQVLAVQKTSDNEVVLSLEIEHDLACLEGHFPDNPVVPGVAQVHWAEHFAREMFADAMPGKHQFSSLETIKFQNVIQPEIAVNLHLEFNPQKHKLYFSFRRDDVSYSSGRLAYKEQ